MATRHTLRARLGRESPGPRREPFLNTKPPPKIKARKANEPVSLFLPSGGFRPPCWTRRQRWGRGEGPREAASAGRKLGRAGTPTGDANAPRGHQTAGPGGGGGRRTAPGPGSHPHPTCLNLKSSRSPKPSASPAPLPQGRATPPCAQPGALEASRLLFHTFFKMYSESCSCSPWCWSQQHHSLARGLRGGCGGPA